MGGFRLAAPVSLLVLLTTASFGQSVISAHSGLVHYIEGAVTLDDKAVDVKYSQFPEVRNNQVLKTLEGRAEVLLTPGVFLRLAENSSIRMISNRLADTRVEALSGSLMIEHGDIIKDNQVTLTYKDRAISFDKSGLYRLDAENGLLRVYQGEAKVAVAGQSVVAKQAHEVQLEAAVLTSMKFDPKVDDEFYRWASRRANYISMANVSSAKAVRDSGYYTSSVAGTGMWSYNPWFGMFTYVPLGGMWYSPFGYSFFSPFLVNSFYNYYPGYYNNYYYPSGGGGSSTSVGRGRFDSANNYSLPSRPATSTSSTGFSGFSGSRGSSGSAVNPGFGGSRSDGFSGYSGSSASSSGSGSVGVSSGSAVSSGSGGGGASHSGGGSAHGR